MTPQHALMAAWWAFIGLSILGAAALAQYDKRRGGGK